jgi:hypothetical protein
MSFSCKSKAQSVSNTTSPFQSLSFEQIYLHLDRVFYAAGDDIWFKAYLTGTVMSENLHVELISPKSHIVDHKILRIADGTSAGDFHLNDSIPSGRYLVRAYTSYMRNFGELFFYEKVIVVENHLGIADTGPSTTVEPAVDISFFPEGGSLVQGVPAVVAFKAVDGAGKGCSVSGKIVSSKGDTVAMFADSHLGMGTFKFTSNRKLSYFAEGKTSDGLSFRVPIPDALENGYSMQINNRSNNHWELIVRTNSRTLKENPSKTLIVSGFNRNLPCLKALIKTGSEVTTTLVPKEAFPGGISRITLMDSSGIIYAERLVYCEKPKILRVSLSTNKPEYAPREKVNVEISVTDTLNNPVKANLSIAVVNGSKIISAPESDIATFLLLESEIRGNIEQPHFYFEESNPNRLAALDNLLLTQGWRNYIWKLAENMDRKMEYPVERGFYISGSLRKFLVDIPIKNTKISLGIFDKTNQLFKVTTTNKEGIFFFDSLYFHGPANVVISATDINEAGKGLISIDPGKFISPAISYKWNKRNISKTIPESEKEIKDLETFRLNTGVHYKTLKQYKTSDTLLLDEVVVKAKKETTVSESHSPLFGRPDKEIEVTTSMLAFRNIFEILQGKVSWPRMGIDKVKFYWDGVMIDGLSLGQMPVSHVSRVEIHYTGSIIAFYSFKGGNSNYIPVGYSQNNILPGYYQARKFYTPKYDTPSENYNPDYRTTIFWEPYLITDAEGKASCSFYTSDEKTWMRINVEGLEAEKNALVSEGKYEVK